MTETGVRAGMESLKKNQKKGKDVLKENPVRNATGIQNTVNMNTTGNSF